MGRLWLVVTVAALGGCFLVAPFDPAALDDPSPECVETFRFTSLPGSLSRQSILDPGGALYVGGATGASGWVAAFDTCTGERSAIATVEVVGTTSSWINSMAILGDEVVAIGMVATETDAGEGLYARLSKDALAVLDTHALIGSAGRDDITGIAVAADGDLWMAGSADMDAAPSLWAIKATPAGDACGFDPGLEGAGLGRAVVTHGDDVWVAGDADAETHLFRYRSEACSVQAPCPCPPEWESPPLDVGSASTLVLDLLFVDERLFAAGLGRDVDAGETDQFAFVAELDTSTGEPTSVYRYDPTEATDGFTGLAAVGGHLYVGGARDWNGTSEGFAYCQGVVLSLPLSLGSADWIAQPEGSTVVWGISADERGVFASGDAADSALVLSCTLDGLCG